MPADAPVRPAPRVLPLLCGAVALLSALGFDLPGALAAVVFAALAIAARRRRAGVAGWAAGLGLGWGAWCAARCAMLLVAALAPTRPAGLPWQFVRLTTLAVLGAWIFAVAVAGLVTGLRRR